MILFPSVGSFEWKSGLFIGRINVQSSGLIKQAKLHLSTILAGNFQRSQTHSLKAVVESIPSFCRTEPAIHVA